jgi:hypothetical protein
MSDFDPLAILGALERHRVAYVIVGDLAGVLHGTDLTADTVEITPSLKPENRERLDRALDDLGASAKRRATLQTLTTESDSLPMPTTHGDVVITVVPSGTGGFEDLRRAAQREPLGQGIRAPVISAPDLVRSLSSEGRNVLLEQRLRRLVDLERRLSPEM